MSYDCFQIFINIQIQIHMQIQIHHIKKYKLRQKSQHKFHLANPAAMPVESQCGGTFLSKAFYLTLAFWFRRKTKIWMSANMVHRWYTWWFTHDDNAQDWKIRINWLVMSFCNLYIGKLQTAETSPQYFVIDGSCQDFDIFLTKAGNCDEWRNLNWKITTKSSVWKTM